jgi:L-iditol 2-dehydrogenase
MGHEAAGDVIEVGDGVTSVRPGDRVALRSILPCGACEWCRRGESNICPNRRGLGMQFDGAYADRIVLPETMLLVLPDALSYTDGALIEPLAVAMHAVNRTPFDLMDVVVVIGAGAIGLLTLLAARLRGAGSIVVTDRNEHRLAMARSLGADVTVNVDEADPVTVVRNATGGRGADAVFEAVGIGPTVAQSLATARSGGQVTWIGNSVPTVELSMQELVTRELTLRGAYTFNEEFEQAAAAIAAGLIDVARLIELTAPLDQAPELFRQLGAAELDVVKVILVPNE